MHNKMETLLGMKGAYVDAIYYCPHHPDKGFAGKITELKCDCSCRKIKPRMLLQAAADYNIDFSRSWMVGDGEQDIQTGIAAGCRMAFIGDSSYPYGQTVTADSLLAFVNRCLE